MATLLGIDIGRAKTGVAKASGLLAEPVTVLHEQRLGRLAQKIVGLADREGATTIVMGLPEGQLASPARALADLLTQTNFQVVLWDETLTTRDAQQQAIQAHIPQKKRQHLEDAFAATLILQSYLDSGRS